jgi:hypothetical protein
MSISSTRFTQTYNEAMVHFNAKFNSFVEPKKRQMFITEFGDVFDKEQNYEVYGGMEKETISKLGFVKCTKKDATHYIIVCDTILPNGVVKNIKSKGWFRLS